MQGKVQHNKAGAAETLSGQPCACYVSKYLDTLMH